MKLAYIAIRLTDVASHTLQPFLGTLRGQVAEAHASESAWFYPRAILYWRRLSQRLKQPLLVNRHTTRNLIQISQRIDMHFSCLSSTFVSQTLDSMQPWVAGSQLSFSYSRKHSTHYWATNPFGVHAPGADPFADRSFIKASSFPLSAPNSINDIITTSAAISPDVKQRSLIDKTSFLFRNRSGALRTLQPRQLIRRLQAADESSPQSRETIPRKFLTPMHPSISPFKMPARSFVGGANRKSVLLAIAKTIGLSWLQHAAPYKLAKREFANESDAFPNKPITSVTLVWRKPTLTADVEDFVTTMNMHDAAIGKPQQSTVMDGRWCINPLNLA